MRRPRVLPVLIALVLVLAGPAVAAPDLLTAEHIGPLKYGTPQSAVLRAFGRPSSKSAETYEGATGDWIQTWSYPGLRIDMASQKKGAAKSLVRLTVTRAGLRTARGIGVGSGETAVRKAYADVIDRSGGGAAGHIVAGSIYGGVIFTIKNGKVVEIFLGAAAE
jgi:hypothetical protein